MSKEYTTEEKHSLIASDRVEGTAVRGGNGNQIGKIERLMIDKVSGTIAYAVVNYGGFLTVGQKHFPVPWASLTYNPKLNAYELNTIPADEELAKAPSFEAGKDFDWGDRTKETSLHLFYRVSPYWATYG